MIFYKKLSKIKAVSFDLDDTLYDNHPVIDEAERWFKAYLVETYELPEYVKDPEFWRQIKKYVCKSRPELLDDVGELRIAALSEIFKRFKLKQAEDKTVLVKLLSLFIEKRSRLTYPQSSIELLKSIRCQYPIAAVSNGNSNLIQIGVAGLFDYDLRPSLGKFRRKPFPDLFLEFARLQHIDTSEILHVGDEPETDIEGAVLAGCQCIWLKHGYAGKSSGEADLRCLPTAAIDSIEELKYILC